MGNKIKLAILVPTLRFGGGERVASNLINQLNEYKDLDIKVILYDKSQIDYSIKTKNVISINEKTDLKNNFKRFIAFVRKYFKIKNILKKEQIDVSLAIMPSMNIFSLLSHKKSIITIHNVVRRNNFLILFLQKFLYKKAKKIVAVSYGVKESVLKNINNNLDIDVIYNPLDIDKIRELSHEKVDVEYEYILGVGRLTKQKGFDILIKAIKYLPSNLNLIILGEGPEKDNLFNLVKELKLENRVYFLGFVENPYKYMKNSKCFVLSSRWEGFGLVLAEALIAGSKVVSFNCKAGPNEILENGKLGTLVDALENPKALAEGIIKEINIQRDISIINKSIKRFDINEISKKYYKLIKDSI